MEEKFADNNGVQVHYIAANQSSGYPVVFIPGAISGAEDIYECIKEHLDFYSIFISIRGRGKTSKPVSGYSKEDQISDIEAVIDKEQIGKFYIFGHSFGASLASYYSITHPEKILGLILADYPPVYPNYSEKWAEYIFQNFEGIDKNFVNGMVRDGRKEDFNERLSKLQFKKLIIKAASENSLLKEEIMNNLSKTMINIETAAVNSGHEMFFENPAEVVKIIKKFVKNT